MARSESGVHGIPGVSPRAFATLGYATYGGTLDFVRCGRHLMGAVISQKRDALRPSGLNFSETSFVNRASWPRRTGFIFGEAAIAPEPSQAVRPWRVSCEWT